MLPLVNVLEVGKPSHRDRILSAVIRTDNIESDVQALLPRRGTTEAGNEATGA